MNPLLSDYSLPPFHKIEAAHIVPAIEEVIAQNRNQIEAITQLKNPTWENVMYTLEGGDALLSRAWSPVSHLNSVKNTPELRAAYVEAEPKLTEYGTWVGQNTALYQQIRKLQDSSDFANYSKAQQQALKHAVRDFKLAGVALEGDKRAHYAQLKQELSQLQTQFEHNVMDCTDAWHIDVKDEEKLTGIPEAILMNAKQKAQEAKAEGWRLGLDFPTYYSVITYADDQSLRQTFHQAFATRAATTGPHGKKFDNTDIIKQIVSKRQELANLLGFESYAEYSLAPKMAKSSTEVFDFLNQLVDKARPFAQRDYQSLQAFAKNSFNVDKLEAWDIAYYSEKQKQALFEITEEVLRPYFPIEKVLKGMFEIVNRLYGMRIEKHEGVPVWHDDVTFYDIFDANGEMRGQFYLDPFARANKRGGAWMDDALGRRIQDNGQIQHPVAYLTCNFQPAASNKPALLSHSEVVTLFHEFGHGLHHMMTQIDVADVAGINGVPWDAVELPSQFFENWCWQDEALGLISGHVETGEPLPQAELEKLKKAKNYQSGLFLVRQLEFALFDMNLHHDQHVKDAQSVLDNVRAKVSVIPVPEYNRFQNSFSHIFAGGYAAGYFSYLWAEVLSADAFGRFEDEGIFNQTVGQAFLNNILEQGGSEDPGVLFERFRGRAPTVDALLHHHGLDS